MSPDLAVIGAGVVGLTAALAFQRRHPAARVVVLDKEPAVGRHASGRNSGVLHAGFYYGADSMKARFSREGCAAWKQWCAARDLPVNACGKLVVARSEQEWPRLDDLLARGEANGVEVREVDEGETRAIEPRAATAGRALWSPTTASVDPRAVMDRLAVEAAEQGVDLRLGVEVRGFRGDGRLDTSDGPLEAGCVLNAAGLYADRLARSHGVGERYRILPFKGLYLRGDVPPGWLGVHVYPVPDLRVPFLGVHFTVGVDGAVTIGPTALPALWREQYGGLEGFDARELLGVLRRQAGLFLHDPGFRRLAFREAPRVFPGALAGRAAGLVRDLDPSAWRTWGRPGIRAQLLDVEAGRLVMDFVVEDGDGAVHVLNAISPAFTCALPFAELLADRIEAASG